MTESRSALAQKWREPQRGIKRTFGSKTFYNTILLMLTELCMFTKNHGDYIYIYICLKLVNFSVNYF